MEAQGQHHDADSDKDGRCPADSVAINARYVVHQEGHELVARNLNEQSPGPFHIPIVHASDREDLRYILDLSPVSLETLAVATRSQVLCYNVATRALTHSLRVPSKTITAIAWSSTSSHCLALACLDGYVRLWNTTTPDARVRNCQVVGAVTVLAWSAGDDSILALSSAQQLCIWHTDGYPQLVASFDTQVDAISCMRWHPRHTRTLLAATKTGQIAVYDFTQTTAELPKSASGIFRAATTRRNQRPVKSVSMSSQGRRFAGVSCLLWTNAQQALVLYSGGKHVARIDVRSSRFGTTDWTTELQIAVDTLGVRAIDSRAQDVVAVSSARIEVLDVQMDTPEQPQPNVGFDAVSEHSNISQDSVKRQTVLPHEMTITKVSQSHRQHRLLRRQVTQRGSSASGYHRTLGVQSAHNQKSEMPRETMITRIAQPQPLLETPISNHALPNPSMPFLSPNIPARSLDHRAETLDLLSDMTLPAALDSQGGISFASTLDPESDSDDEEYGAKHLPNLPTGGSHVPSPRSCGATFAPDGRLIIFQPFISKPRSARIDYLLDELSKTTRTSQDLVTHFPRFGNLLAELEALPSVGDSHLELEHEKSQLAENAGQIVQALGLDRASYESGRSWKPQTLPAGTPQLSDTGRTSTSVRVTQLTKTVVSEPQDPPYRFLLSPHESGATLCAENAQIATEHEKYDDALLWRSLSKILALQCPMAAGSTSQDPTADNFAWSDHPFGSAWLIRKLFHAAEIAANLRMLAYMSVVLVGSALTAENTVLGSLKSRLPSQLVKLSEVLASRETTTSNAASMLSLNRVDSQVIDDSPTKLHTESPLSSRHTTQPNTPRLESSSSTPPWSFSGMPHLSQRLSQSSSVSPEHTRSSFSAAVKSYAQSVSDKFAVYSTSPPIKKIGPSPSKDLSSSFPSGGGSWSKTVSFASTAKSSGLGRQTVEQDEGYDSDRTIEDTQITKPTQTSHKADLNIRWRNRDCFSDDTGSGAALPLLPADLMNSCAIWCATYATQLRSTKQDILALQFDKVAGAISATTTVTLFAEERVSGGTVDSQQSVPCSICFCIIDGLEQICLSCRHAFHMSCLADLEISQDSFPCPSGCGCECLFTTLNSMADNG